MKNPNELCSHCSNLLTKPYTERNPNRMGYSPHTQLYSGRMIGNSNTPDTAIPYVNNNILTIASQRLSARSFN